MSTIEITIDGGRRVEAEFAKPIDGDAPEWLALVVAVRQMTGAVQLSALSVEASAPPAGRYTYSFTEDGRTWGQYLLVPADGGEPSMTFDVPSYWRLSEFVANRPVRDAVITLIQRYELTKLEVTW